MLLFEIQTLKNWLHAPCPSVGGGGSALCGHGAEQMWEARWAQLWFPLGWDWPVLGVVGSAP